MTAPATTGRLWACLSAARRAFAVSGLALRALEWPRPGAPGLLLLHGGSAHAHWFDAVAGAFVADFHVLSLDQRGHGESDWPPAPRYATEDFAADLLGVLDALGWERAVLVGHSMGGHNAMAFAAWHPERVRGLCIVDSRPAYPPERLQLMHRRGHRGPRRHESLAAALASFRLLPPDTTAHPALLEHLGRVGIVERQGRYLYRFDPACNGSRRPVDAWPLLARIGAPTLIVRGEHSPVLPRPMAEEMRARIAGARLVEIPGAYHHLVLDAPEAFSAALAAFLAGLA